MAFITSAIIGGAAKRASEIFKEEREEAVENASQKIKIWTELGLPKARARKEAMRTKNKLYDDLEDLQFSAPQIAVIMREGKGQEVIDHIQTQRNTYKDYKLNPADIVSISPDYKDTGLTKDQILQNVLGKVNRGMSVTDAMKDVTGQDGSLTGLFGGDLSGVGNKQMASMAAATGVSMDELRALASDNITYDDKLVQGTITMSDPAAQARAKTALEDSQTGAFTSQAAATNLNSFGNQITGGEAGLTATGSVLYTPQIKARGIAVANKTSAILAAKRKELGRSKFTADELDEMKAEITEWAKENKLHVDLAASQMGSGTSAGTGTGTGTGTSTGGTASTAATNIYSGMPSNSIQRQVIADVKGLSGPQQTAAIAKARMAIIADLSKSMSSADATKQADDIIADIMTKI